MFQSFMETCINRFENRRETERIKCAMYWDSRNNNNRKQVYCSINTYTIDRIHLHESQCLFDAYGLTHAIDITEIVTQPLPLFDFVSSDLHFNFSHCNF